jgi:hypothetical protein
MALGSGPEVLVLRPSKTLWLGIAKGGILLAAGASWVLTTGFTSGAAWELWAPIAGLCVSAGVITSVLALVILTGELRLGRDGFTCMSRVYTVSYLWSDVDSPFSVVHIAGIAMVGMNIRDDRLGGSLMTTLAKRSKRQLGASGALLPQAYGLSANDLEAVMNRWRQRALARARISESS